MEYSGNTGNFEKKKEFVQNRFIGMTSIGKKLMLRLARPVTKTDPPFKTYEYSMKELCRLCNTGNDPDNTAVRRKIMAGLNDVAQTQWIEKPDGSYSIISMVQSISIQGDKVTAVFNPELTFMLIDISKFISAKLKAKSRPV